MTKSKVDFDELAHLADEVRRAHTSVDAGMKGFANAPLVGQTGSASTGGWTPFGNTSAGRACVEAHRQAQQAMNEALKAFSGTVESDFERLELALALYRKTDAEAADNLLAANRNRIDIFTAQMSVGDHGKEQAAQIARLATLVGDQTQGNAIVTGDFNATSSGDTPSARNIRGFGNQGFDVNAGDINDGLGGTSLSHRKIDFVMPRGLATSETERWGRGPSDHDGQLTDVTMPNW